jgi:hypothetical protein
LDVTDVSAADMAWALGLSSWLPGDVVLYKGIPYIFQNRRGKGSPGVWARLWEADNTPAYKLGAAMKSVL